MKVAKEPSWHFLNEGSLKNLSTVPLKGLIDHYEVTLRAKMAMYDLQQYPAKRCLINYKSRIIISKKMLFSIVQRLQIGII